MAHSFKGPDHLPHHRPGGPPDPAGLPRQRAGRTPQMHGRYPDFDMMSERDHWDPVTRRVLEEREATGVSYRFFNAAEQRTLEALLDAVLAQDGEPRIPVLSMIDARLHARSFDGYRYVGMPEDDETWRRVAAHLDGFAALSPAEQIQAVDDFAQGKLAWDDLNAARAWSVITRYALAAFYSHPWAFNEIGFPGPAYPRGYMRRNMGPAGVEPGNPGEAFGLDPVRDVAVRS